MDATLTPAPGWRGALRPLVTVRGYTALTYHLLGLPLGVAYFTWFVTGLSTGLGLAIMLIGIPILTLVLASVRPRFPLGTLTFTVAVTAYGTALYAIAAPIVAPFDPIELGIWRPDSVLEGLALVPLGLVLLVAAGWISEGMAAMSRAVVRWGARSDPGAN